MPSPPKKCPALLLAEARHIASFSGQDWPEEFTPKQIASLMAGGWKGEHLASHQVWTRLINDAINSGTLRARVEPQAPITITRDADGLNDHQRFRRNLVQNINEPGARTVYTVTKTLPARRWIGREACSAWLAAIGAEDSSEYLAEWLRVGGIEQPTAADREQADEPATVQRPATSTGPVQRQRFQEDEILRVIADLGYAATALPKWQPGKSGVKAEVRQKLPRFTPKVFDGAWERLRKSSYIRESE